MNTAELKKLAEAATPGPWVHEKESIRAGEVCSVNQGGGAWFEVWAPNWINKPASSNEQDAAYIAAANPAAILKLLAINAELVEAVKSVIVWFDSEDDHSKADFYERLELCRAADDNCRAALAKAEGGEL